MELTKAKCVFALAGLYSAANGEHDEENKDVLEQLIEEHFILKNNFESSECRVESSLTRSNPPLELENYLKRIQELELKEKQWIETEKDYRDELKELKSNPPLKFEELHEGMWVWDNQAKRYMKVYDISYSEETFNVNGEWYLNDLYLEEFKFEENRFYLKAVEE